MVSFRMILPSSGIIILLLVPYIVGDDCTNCTTTTNKPEAISTSTSSGGNTTEAITIPPEPPNMEVKGRALDTLPPIDDVSMDDEMDMFNLTLVNNTCLPEQVVSKGCEETCTCVSGSLLCMPKTCPEPLVKIGTTKLDPLCIEKPGTDPCCVMLVCSQDTETEPFEGCTYKNISYQRGERFNDACEAVCSCEDAGHVSCKPRCPPVTNTTSDRCVAVPDKKDPCCTLVLCDVSLNDQDVTKAGNTGSEEADNSTDIKLLSAIAVNSTSVKLELSTRPNTTWTVENSVDQTTWSPSVLHGYTVVGLEAGKSYHFRVKYGTSTTNSIAVTLPPVKKTSTMCEYKGKNYTKGEEFHDGCMFYCQCTKSGVECANIECPTDFGLDVLDPHCLSWETQPPDFVPHPPTCCPETVKCKDNGSCVYMGERFPNWADIPTKLSGCEQRCYCEMGNVTCHAACPPVPATPPSDLPCPPRQAILSHQHGDECCLLWMCPQHTGFNEPPFPGGFPSNPTHDPNEIKVHSLEAVDESTVRLVFSVPSVLVGLHGRVELRYTADKQNSDPSTWEQQVLAPPDDLIATPELEFELGGLQPDTTYKIKIAVELRDLQNSPVSEILTVKTLPRASSTTVYPPEISVEPELRVAELNSTWVKVEWRTFSEFELQFIDGVQLRYKEPDGKVFAATPLIHRAVTSYIIEDLKPDTQYQVGIFFIPFPGQTTELRAQDTLHITTAIENDPYKFDLVLDVHHIKTSSVELTWTGVPYPEDKYVNIYRAIYQSEGGREDFSSFKVAKRDAPANTLIQGLKPATRYRLWLEAYLTNGRIKKSNVKDFTTKPGAIPAADTLQGQLEASPIVKASDYYIPLIGVSILAALAIVAVVILLLILHRKHGHNKAPITAANTRKPQSAAYDNPSYKVEIQQETMDL